MQHLDFTRSCALPEPIDQEASKAKYDNGVIKLELVKKHVSIAKRLTFG